jgi:MYXO-CTERM domain-containing protein
MRLRPSLALAVALASSLAPCRASAATLDWKGHTWQVTSGGMAGVCEGNPANVSIDANGFLHFRISNAGGTWTASEIFTTDKLGFGTYQWHVDGPIDVYDENVVLGLFPYGPAAGIGDDGTNEIDIEYSRWGRANGPNGDFTNYPASGTTIGEMSYTFSLGGMTLSTSRFTWTATSITSSLLGGLQPVGGNEGLIKTWTYAPSNPTVNIPQQALPLGMNLWCFEAPPSDGQPVEIVIRDFTFVPAGSEPGVGGGGSGGSGAVGGGAGAAGAGGRDGNGGTAGSAAGGETGGAAGASAGASTTSGSGGPGGGASGRGGPGGSMSVAGATAGSAELAGTTGAAGAAGTGASSQVASDRNGCGCSVGTTSGERAASVAGLLAMVLVSRRRRRRAATLDGKGTERFSRA